MNRLQRRLLVAFCVYSSLSGGVREFVESIETVSIESLTQKIEGDTIHFAGAARALVDDKLALCAEELVIDKGAQTLCAQARPDSYISIETNEFYMLCRVAKLSLRDRTGRAEQVRVHFGGTFIAAEQAYRRQDGTWVFENVVYTGCDHPIPHWSFGVHSATLHKDAVRCAGLLFKVGRMPLIGLPSLSLPAPKVALPRGDQAKSGLLFPGISYSARLGFGIDPAYYLTLGPNADTTIGLKWIEKKGYVYHHELRRGTRPQSHSWLYAQYAKELKAFKEKEQEIVRASDHRYWLEGEHFQQLHLGEFELQTLSRLDFGTDKQIGYDFFYRADAIEDRFLNSVVLRFFNPKHFFIAKVEREKVFRDQFFISEREKSETEDRLSESRLPHLWWNTAYTRLGTILSYKHEMFADVIAFHRQVRTNLFDGSKIVASKTSDPLPRDATARFYYEGSLRTDLRTRGQTLHIALRPNVQARSKRLDPASRAQRNVYEAPLGGEGTFRAFVSGHAEWALPEVTYHTEDFGYVHYMQPFFRFTWVPRFKQRHWFFADEWDRIFPQQQIEFELRNNWFLKETEVDILLRGAYEFLPKTDIFPLRRAPRAKHFLPFLVQGQVMQGPFHVRVAQEFDVGDVALVQSEVDVGFSIEQIDVMLSWVYQSPKLQKQRELLSDIPSFALLEVSIPFTDTIKIGYGSHLYSKKNSPTGWLQDRNALLHRLHVSYNGHCWAVSAGFEEKRFRQQGELKGERQYFFSFKLDSLVSVSKSFRAEPITILQAPDDF